MAGYHLRKITKGTLGEISKIREEFEELEDAVAQGYKIMALCECADLVGAIEAFVQNRGFALSDVLSMMEATKRAFAGGERK